MYLSDVRFPSFPKGLNISFFSGWGCLFVARPRSLPPLARTLPRVPSTPRPFPGGHLQSPVGGHRAREGGAACLLPSRGCVHTCRIRMQGLLSRPDKPLRRCRSLSQARPPSPHYSYPARDCLVLGNGEEPLLVMVAKGITLAELDRNCRGIKGIHVAAAAFLFLPRTLALRRLLLRGLLGAAHWRGVSSLSAPPPETPPPQPACS